MPSHKFHVSESVTLVPAISRQCARRRLSSDQTTPAQWARLRISHQKCKRRSSAHCGGKRTNQGV